MADTFALDIAKFVNKAGGNVKQVVRKIGVDLVGAVVDRTPVGNRELWAVNKGRKAKGLPLYPPNYVGGRARFNWNVAFDRIDTITTHNVDPTGERAKNRNRIILNGWDHGQTIYITNSLPYMGPLEYEAHSSQAPSGMVRLTVSEWHGFVNKAVSELPK